MSMIEIYNNIKDMIRAKLERLFKKQTIEAVAVVEVAEPVPQPEVQKKPKKEPKTQNDEADKNYGVFTHFDDLLDKMDTYFKYLKLLKKDDRDAFDLYSKVGGQIIGKSALIQQGTINSDWMAARPSFGMAHMINEDSEYKGDHLPSVTPKLMYFQKVRQAPHIQKTENEIYNLVMYYVDTRKPKLRKPFSWHVELLPDGSCRALKELTVSYAKVGKRNPDWIPQRRWSLPEGLINLFYDHKYTNQNVHQLSSNIFAMLANGCWYASHGVRINAKRGDLMGVFNVAMDRTAYFFKDRERVTNANGKTARIFHVTRPHKRVLPDGREINVKMHFRGLRKFEWMGYQINITVPGIHHPDLNAFSAPVETFEDVINDTRGKLDMGQMGDLLASHIAQQPIPAPRAG